MSHHFRLYRRALLVAVLAASFAAAGGAGAASKTTVAVLGGAAPEGGQFAGPGFTGFPVAGGDGWIAFRGEVIDGRTTETLVVAHMTAPTSRAQVANLGQAAPADGAFTACAGTLRQFVGHPAVNARGEVAFLALIAPAEEPPADDFETPVAAGIFVYRGGQLRPIACSGQETSAGRLDLVAVVDLFAEPGSQVAERSPALNDGGDVAFLAGTVDADGIPSDAAIFLVPRDGAITPLVKTSQPFAGGEIANLGPPALNNLRRLAFHAFATTTDTLVDTDGVIDGIFATTEDGSVSIVAKDDLIPFGLPSDFEPLFEFDDGVAINDNGDVAFLAGPIFADLTDDGGPGVLVHADGITRLIAYPGQSIGPDRIGSVRLGSVGGNQIATPSLTPDGKIVFFASLNSGSGEAILRWDPGVGEPFPLVYTLGPGATTTPAGGMYDGAGSAPAADAVGGIVFLARIVGGATSEAIVYRPATGNGSPIVVGDAAPTAGFFAGAPFSAPSLNDRGDVVFRAFVARGPASIGIFRVRDEKLEALVRPGDPSPNPGSPPFLDLVGEPSVNADGVVAFAATVADLGRGIYLVDESGIVRKIAVRDDPFLGAERGSTFLTLAANPAINGFGQVAFRGTVGYFDFLNGFTVRRDGIFLSDGGSARALVYAREPSPAGLPFLTFRDPVLTDLPSIVFRAPLGTIDGGTSGLFVADTAGTAQVVMEQDDLGGGVRLSSFSGDPAANPAGDLVFLATRTEPFEPGSPLLRPLGPAILRRSSAGLQVVARQGMAGPAGGVFRSFGQPSINRLGHVAFRGSFVPGTGGTNGIFLAKDDGLTPHVLLRETAPGGGRLSSFQAQVSLNANDEIAFSAGVSQGEARSALILASPTTLKAGRLAFRIRASVERPRDRIQLNLRLKLGRVTNGLAPREEPVTVSVGDTAGTLWSVTVPAGQLDPRRGAFVITPRADSPLRGLLHSLRLTPKKANVRVSAVSAPLDLTFTGFRPLKPPFTAMLQVGDDSGTAVVACKLGKHGGRCSRRAR